jgi:hypothetical protein
MKLWRHEEYEWQIQQRDFEKVPNRSIRNKSIINKSNNKYSEIFKNRLD